MSIEDARSTPQVHRLALGLAALGRPAYINLGHADDFTDRSIRAMQARTHTILDAAWNAGIRHFDAARSYGKAEVFLASWLNDHQPAHDDVMISSKWGYTYTGDWQIDIDGPHEVKDHSLDALQRQWQETHTTLGGWLDLYQIHSAKLDTGVLDDADVLKELASLKAQHGIRIGLSLSGAGQADTLEKALAVRVDGVPLFSSVQATWNLLEPSIGDMLQAAHDAGWLVIVKEALANGRLTPTGSQQDLPGFPTLQAEADRLGTTVDALALAAVLTQPWADRVLLGPARLDHLQSNLKALHVDWDAQAAYRLGDLVEAPADYWRKRGSLPWN